MIAPEGNFISAGLPANSALVGRYILLALSTQSLRSSAFLLTTSALYRGFPISYVSQACPASVFPPPRAPNRHTTLHPQSGRVP